MHNTMWMTVNVISVHDHEMEILPSFEGGIESDVFDIYIKDQTKDIDHDLEILPQITKELSLDCEIYIKPENKMWMTVNVLPPVIVTERIYPTKDSLVREDRSFINFGTSQTLSVGSSTMSYLGFDFSSLPEDMYVEKIELKLNKPRYSFPEDIHVNLTSYDWYEIGINWINKPQLDDYIGSFRTTNDKIEQVFDITDQPELLDDKISICLHGDGLTYFDSRESQNSPYIEVSYSLPPTSVGIINADFEILPQISKELSLDCEIFVDSDIREVYGELEIEIPGFYGEIGFDCEIEPIWEQQLIHDSEIYIKQQSDTLDFDSEILPQLSDSIEIDSEIYIKLRSDELGLDCEILPQSSNSLEYELEIYIKQESAELSLDSEILPQLIAELDIESEVYIKLRSDEVLLDSEILPSFNNDIQNEMEIYIKKESVELSFDFEIFAEDVRYYEHDLEIYIEERSDEIDHELEVNVIDIEAEYSLDCEIDASAIFGMYIDCEILVSFDSQITLDCEIYATELVVRKGINYGFIM